MNGIKGEEAEMIDSRYIKIIKSLCILYTLRCGIVLIESYSPQILEFTLFIGV